MKYVNAIFAIIATGNDNLNLRPGIPILIEVGKVCKVDKQKIKEASADPF